MFLQKNQVTKETYCRSFKDCLLYQENSILLLFFSEKCKKSQCYAHELKFD